MRKLVFIAILLSGIVTQAQTVMIKSVELYGNIKGIKKSQIYIQEESKSYTIPLEKYDNEGIQKNMTTLLRLLNNYLEQGSDIVDSNSVSSTNIYWVVIDRTYILKKRKDYR